VAFTRLGSPACVNRSIEVGTALAKLNGQVQMGEVNASDEKSQALVKQYAPGRGGVGPRHSHSTAVVVR